MELDRDPRALNPEIGWYSACLSSVLQVRGADRRELAAAERETLLADAVAGKDRRVLIEAVVFRQDESSVNANLIRFKPSVLRPLAKGFVGQPFLRDHAADVFGARAGTVVASEFVGEKGVGEIRQTLELAAPWAVEAAVRGLMDRFSIGWRNTADVICSECDAPFFRSFFGSMPTCDHEPGTVIEDKKGKRVVEMVVTGADALETSAVNMPAVNGTGIIAPLAALAMQRGRIHRSEIRMSKLATMLGLADDASQESLASAVEKLRDDRDREATLRASNVEALKASEAARATAEAQLAAHTKVQRDGEIEAGLAIVRGKVGPKIVAGKPERGGTKEEAFFLRLADRDVADALAFADALPQVLPPAALRSRVPATAPHSAMALTAEEKAKAKKAGVSEESYLAARNSVLGTPAHEEEED